MTPLSIFEVNHPKPFLIRRFRNSSATKRPKIFYRHNLRTSGSKPRAKSRTTIWKDDPWAGDADAQATVAVWQYPSGGHGNNHHFRHSWLPMTPGYGTSGKFLRWRDAATCHFPAVS